MRFFLTTIFLLITVQVFAQRQNVYFLKNDGRHVTIRDSADFIRIVREPDSSSNLYNIFEFYPNGDKKLMGKSSIIDPPKFEGVCVEYYKNGKRKTVSNYKGGAYVGVQYEFYPNGNLYIALKYPDVPPSVFSGLSENYLITDENDSLGNALIKNGNGYYKKFDDKFKNIVDEGAIKDGKREGQWKGIDEGLHVKYFENYTDGNLMSGISIDEKGDTVKYAGDREVEPHYKGGLKAFYNYITNNVVYPDYERANDIHGKVMLSFIVEKDGKITDIKVLNSVSVNIDNEAIRVLKNSRNWVPGTEYGRTVRVSYTIPMNFSLE